VCTICGYKQVEETAALGHKFGDWEVTANSDCVNTGLQKRTCSVCDAEETQTIAALGHKYGNWELVTPATASTNGEKVRTCSVCKDGTTGHKDSAIIPAGFVITSKPNSDGTGTQLTLAVDGKDSSEATNGATWTSSNEEVATVDKGIVEYKGTGTVVITAVYGDNIATISLLSIKSDGNTEIQTTPSVAKLDSTDSAKVNTDDATVTAVSADVPDLKELLDDGSSIELVAEASEAVFSSDAATAAMAEVGQDKNVEALTGALDLSLIHVAESGETIAENVEPAGPVTVTIAVTLSEDVLAKIAAGANVIVLHEVNGGYEALDAIYEGGAVTFTTDSFSNFYVALATDKPVVDNTTSADTTPAADTVTTDTAAASGTTTSATTADGTTLAATGDAFGALFGVFAGIAVAAVALLGALIWRRRKMQL
jgi:LPXTG-motif cell wall-anchored protein